MLDSNRFVYLIENIKFSSMAFVLVHCYEEDQCDVVPTNRVVLEDGEDSVEEGMKRSVKWPSKIRGKPAITVPGEISAISGLFYISVIIDNR